MITKLTIVQRALMPNESEETEVKKDLNWFKEQLDDIEMNTPRLCSHDSIWMLDRVNELLNQLDEPEVLSQELPVIPKFVADWIEEAKGRHHSLYEAMADYCSPEMNQWIQDFYHSDLFAKAWLDGYTVEKEQKYYVLDSEDIPLLERANNQTCKTTTGLSIHEDGRDNSRFELTEQEIKDYDDRYWPFAVKVEELEE